MSASSQRQGVQIQDRYRLQQSIGGSRMAVVFRAVDTALFDRVVAIKVLRHGIGGDPKVRQHLKQRFHIEARLSTLLGYHPNIIQILDYGVTRGQPFLVMEYLGQPPLRGMSLEQMIVSQGCFAPNQVIRLAQQICAGLYYAHGFERKVDGRRIRGVLHRDLKPSNIFVLRDPLLGPNGDRIKLLDFGVAKILSDITVTLGTGRMGFVGSLQYSSPEQLRGKALDARSDIYSLGVILYRLLTGRFPLRPESESIWAWIEAHTHQPPIDIQTLPLADPIPTALSQVVMNCLEKDPDRRYPSMASLSRDLDGAW